MGTGSEASKTPGGAPIQSCEDDEHCSALSCEECMEEIPPGALSSPAGEEYALRHCGAECVEKMRKKASGE